MKPEPQDDDEVPPKRREKTPSDELHMYSVDELAQFRKKDLVADVALLEGSSFPLSLSITINESHNLTTGFQSGSRTPYQTSEC